MLATALQSEPHACHGAERVLTAGCPPRCGHRLRTAVPPVETRGLWEWMEQEQELVTGWETEPEPERKVGLLPANRWPSCLSALGSREAAGGLEAARCMETDW